MDLEEPPPEDLTDLASPLHSFLLRLSKSELEEFELDKTSVYYLNTAEGAFNQHAALILLRTMEVRIRHDLLSLMLL